MLMIRMADENCSPEKKLLELQFELDSKFCQLQVLLSLEAFKLEVSTGSVFDYAFWNNFFDGESSKLALKLKWFLKQPPVTKSPEKNSLAIETQNLSKCNNTRSPENIV